MSKLMAFADHIKIAWISDSHITSAAPARLTALQAAISTINTWNADLAVVTGDIVENNENDTALMAAALAALGGLTCTWAFCLGNHDLIPDNSHKSPVYGPTWLAAWKAAAGISDFVRAFNVGKARIIMADTNYTSSGTYGWTDATTIPTAQLDWIENELATTTQDFAVICSHHSPGLSSQYTDYPDHAPTGEEQATIQAMLDGQAIPKIWLCGHDHPDGILHPNRWVPVAAPAQAMGKFGTTPVLDIQNCYATGNHVGRLRVGTGGDQAHVVVELI